VLVLFPLKGGMPTQLVNRREGKSLRADSRVQKKASFVRGGFGMTETPSQSMLPRGAGDSGGNDQERGSTYILLTGGGGGGGRGDVSCGRKAAAKKITGSPRSAYGEPQNQTEIHVGQGEGSGGLK